MGMLRYMEWTVLVLYANNFTFLVLPVTLNFNKTWMFLDTLFSQIINVSGKKYIETKIDPNNSKTEYQQSQIKNV